MRAGKAVTKNDTDVVRVTFSSPQVPVGRCITLYLFDSARPLGRIVLTVDKVA